MTRIMSHLTKELRDSFPDNFLWGASISPHQVEGDTYNQWTKWELETAVRSAAAAEKKWSKLPIWKDAKDEATNPDNYISGHGQKHYKMYEEDFRLARSLGLNTFRFSIEWSRIEPEEGVFNLEALQHYKRYIAAAIKAGLTPIVGLWHWTNPIWFEEKGGFAKAANLKAWHKYVEKVADELDFADVKYVTTINEANTYIGMSYFLGEFPYRNKNKLEAGVAYYNLVRAHRIAYKTLKLRLPHLKVGIVHQINKIIPKDTEKFFDRLNARIYAYANQWWVLNRVHRHSDFIGLNYYFAEYRHGLDFSPFCSPSEPLSDLGWYMEPSGVEWAVSQTWKKYKKPIIIAENGLADAHDSNRLWWITETMHALSASRRDGVNILGYCHWSLIDNFEWQFGWFPKFGLISVDRKTYKRTVKESAKTWGEWLLHR